MSTARRSILFSKGFANFEDNFNRADGAIGNGWAGSTWNIVSNNVVNTPTLGAELLTDPGLEANYTAGKCDTLTVGGVPILTQSADVHSGTKAQEFLAVANNGRVNWPTFAGVARQWYQFSVWTKRLAGSNTTTRIRLFQTNSLPDNAVESAIVDAAYAQKKVSSLSTDTNALNCYPAIETGSSAFNQVVVDDGSCKAITFSSLFAMRPLGSANGIAKIKLSAPVDATYCGIVARADVQTSPDDFILALIRRHPTYSVSGLLTTFIMKKVNNAYTVVQAGASVTEVAGAWFELRYSGSTVSLWYNNIQIGTNQTISDVEILNNGYHGLFSTGDNAITDFYSGVN